MSRGDLRIGKQHLTAVTEGVAHETQSADFVAIAIQARTGIRGGCVRLIAAALVFEVAAVTAPVPCAMSVFANEAFVTGPRKKKCTVNAEVFD